MVNAQKTEEAFVPLASRSRLAVDGCYRNRGPRINQPVGPPLKCEADVRRHSNRRHQSIRGCYPCGPKIKTPTGPPTILRGGKYMTRVGGGVRSRFELTPTVGKYMTRTGGLKLALALIGSSGEILIDWSRKNRMTGNGIYTN